MAKTNSSFQFDYEVIGPAETIVDVAFLFAGIAVGTAGNLLTVLSVAGLRQMRSVTNLLVANVAAADLLVCACFMPTILASRLAGQNVFSGLVCELFGFILMAVTGVSNFSFTLIAVARNLCVLHRSTYRTCFARGRVLVYCVACWVTWLACCGIVWWQRGFGYISEAFLCFYSDDDSPFVLSFVLTLLAVAVPSVTAATCYTSLFVRLFLIRRATAGSLQPASHTSGNSVNKEWRALAHVITAFTVFNACWVSYSIHVYFGAFVAYVGRFPHKAVSWLAVFNSALNPIIYGLMNPNFRRGYVRVLRGALCGIRAMPAVEPVVLPPVQTHAAANSNPHHAEDQI